MNSMNFVDRLNDKYFDGKLSNAFAQALSALPVDRPDVHAVVERMFALMSRGKYPPKDLSAMHGHILGSLLARILPGGWEGRVPPITVAGRHTVIDKYLARTALISDGAKRMMDIGCGFPPHTTVETASAFPDWTIIGVDPSLPKYLAYDEEGNYCTFDENRRAVYFQPAAPTVDSWNALLADSRATRSRFESLLDDLLSREVYGGPDDYPRVLVDPLSERETPQMYFRHGGIGQVEIEPVDVIRCFNVMYYFDKAFYEDALIWFGEKLNENGILLIGGDWAFTSEANYFIYKKVNGALVPVEFNFSLDNLTPLAIVSWYAMSDDDVQSGTLADYLSLLREDSSFMEAYYALHDKQRETIGLVTRGADGYYTAEGADKSPGELWGGWSEIVTDLGKSSLVDDAVSILNSRGLSARRNEVNHIAVAL